MIQSSKPKYRIRYRQCNDKNHGGQKLNFVCLNEKCCENSLICSMCREDTHKGHTIQPLKFYIQTIKQRYQSDNIDYSKQFQYLEDSRSRFLHKLRQSVENVAEEFQKLEQQIMQRFEILRNQIIQNQSKKNKFSEFYDSLTSQSEDSPEFLIQNYLPTKQIPNLENFQPIEELGKKLSTFILETRDNLFSDLRKVQKVETNLKFQQKLASSVTKVGHLYSQTNLLANCPTTMSAVVVDLVKNMQQHKIKIRIAKMKKGAFVHIGAIEKQLFNSLKNKAPAVWNTPTNLGKLYFFNNQAVTFGHSSSTLKTFSQNSNIQISMSGNTMKMGMKKNSAQYNLANVNEYYFFFNLQGQVEIQLTYLKK